MNSSTQAGDSAVDVASRMFDAIEAGDMDSFRSCFADGATVWLNVSGVDNSVDDTSAHLTEMLKGFKSFKYTDREFFPCGRTAFAKYTVSLHPVEGGEIAIPAISHVQFSDEGKISRMEEYFDSGALHPSDG